MEMRPAIIIIKGEKAFVANEIKSVISLLESFSFRWQSNLAPPAMPQVMNPESSEAFALM